MDKIEALAKHMGVTTADLAGFIECLRVWIAKGYTMEQAIERHMAQMNRLANNSAHHALRAIAVEAHSELAA